MDSTWQLETVVETCGETQANVHVLMRSDRWMTRAADTLLCFRIFGLEFLDELVKIEAHDSEVLCLEFSPVSTGTKRDRTVSVWFSSRGSKSYCSIVVL